MSIVKLKNDILKKISGGLQCAKIECLDESKDMAIYKHPLFPMLFNPEVAAQIERIITGRATFDGTIDVDENKYKFYTYSQICEWRKDVKRCPFIKVRNVKK